MISILADTLDDQYNAQVLSKQLGLPLFDEQDPTQVVLMVGKKGYWLRRLTTPMVEWTIDFLSQDYQQSFAQRTRHNDPLARAIGLHKKADLKILDMTAGLGKDALWLAHCGAEVTMLERHPALAFLLNHASQNQPKMKVVCMDAKDYLTQTADDYFDVAYYDPMFCARTKTALVKKDMQLLQALHGGENPDPQLIPAVLCVIPKIVVKRAKADPLLLPNPHHQLFTKVTRFDVYTRSI